MNGAVVLGNGSGLCGACHGTGASPWPTTAAHPGHENPTITPAHRPARAVTPCRRRSPDPTHLDGIVQVTFTGPRGRARRLARLERHLVHDRRVPRREPRGPGRRSPYGPTRRAHAAKCGACHGIPPSQHTTSTSCNLSVCHGSEVAISAQGVPSISGERRDSSHRRHHRALRALAGRVTSRRRGIQCRPGPAAGASSDRRGRCPCTSRGPAPWARGASGSSRSPCGRGPCVAPGVARSTAWHVAHAGGFGMPPGPMRPVARRQPSFNASWGPPVLSAWHDAHVAFGRWFPLWGSWQPRQAWCPLGALASSFAWQVPQVGAIFGVCAEAP